MMSTDDQPVDKKNAPDSKVLSVDYVSYEKTIFQITKYYKEIEDGKRSLNIKIQNFDLGTLIAGEDKVFEKTLIHYSKENSFFIHTASSIYKQIGSQIYFYNGEIDNK